jgi:hypothetical protein
MKNDVPVIPGTHVPIYGLTSDEPSAEARDLQLRERIWQDWDVIPTRVGSRPLNSTNHEAFFPINHGWHDTNETLLHVTRYFCRTLEVKREICEKSTLDWKSSGCPRERLYGHVGRSGVGLKPSNYFCGLSPCPILVYLPYPTACGASVDGGYRRSADLYPAAS